jgi:hypothetical protein
MFARYGIVNRSDMEDAMKRSEECEKQQSKDIHTLCTDAPKKRANLPTSRRFSKLVLARGEDGRRGRT